VVDEIGQERPSPWAGRTSAEGARSAPNLVSRRHFCADLAAAQSYFPLDLCADRPSRSHQERTGRRDRHHHKVLRGDGTTSWALSGAVALGRSAQALPRASGVTRYVGTARPAVSGASWPKPDSRATSSARKQGIARLDDLPRLALNAHPSRWFLRDVLLASLGHRGFVDRRPFWQGLLADRLCRGCGSRRVLADDPIRGGLQAHLAVARGGCPGARRTLR
jgi:hypothetical protein